MQPVKQLSVLIIDDAVLVLKRIEEIIRELPCVSEVYTAETHDSAVQLIIEKNPQVVLLDIHLPGKSGIEILQFLRTEYPHTKVVMVSNKATDYYREVCRENGAHGFVDKSKEFEKIPTIIESYA